VRKAGLHYPKIEDRGGVVAIQTLSRPFSSWREGLLALAGALEDPHRERIVVERLEATAAKIGIGPRDICSLALLVTSRARLESYPRPEPAPEIARMIEIANASGELNRLMVGIVDNIESRQAAQKRKVFSAFPETDPRRLLNDTIFGSAAAELSDVAQRLGEADPSSRLAVRLSLWFSASTTFRVTAVHFLTMVGRWSVWFVALLRPSNATMRTGSKG
jgi:hypothetical protein